MNSTVRTVVAIIAGLAAMFLAGLILFPLVKMVVQKYFLIVESGYSLNKLIVDTTFFAWIAVAGFAGGFVAALLAASKNILHALITGITALVGILLFTLFSKFGDSWNGLLGGVGLLLFSLIGGLIQQKIALSKYETI